ncbi:MAG TPA: ABC transporter substrate-binding protein [Acidimicrobiales bacterium]|nr:ABC transporter substrate-binding protein [Acidimicrobiales bacterium]
MPQFDHSHEGPRQPSGGSATSPDAAEGYAARRASLGAPGHPAGEEAGQPVISRRQLLMGVGGGAAFLGADRLLGTGKLMGAAARRLTGSASSSSNINIGFVGPQTGSLADFATSNNFALSQIRQTSAYSKGFKVGGKSYSVTILSKDSQSDPNRASEVARDLILNNNIDLMITSSTPETDNPVAVLCESEGVPCVSTVVPWQAWYAGLGGDPVKPVQKFEFNVMFFFGLEGFGKCFISMWDRIRTNKVVAEMFPNDADGNAFRAAFPPMAKAAGYKPVDGGAYPDGTANFTTMISDFKSHDCELFVNVPLPPDFNTFWKQAAQQGFKPKLATVAKVLLFPDDVKALGSLVDNVATDSWWSPFAPYKSSLTGLSAAGLAEAYQQSTGQQWTQAIGSTYAAFEVAYNALSTASDPHDHHEVADKLHTMKYEGMNGEIDFTSGPAPGVAVIPAAGVQWKPGKPGKFTDFPYAMYVVDNSDAPSWPLNGTLEPTNA